MCIVCVRGVARGSEDSFAPGSCASVSGSWLPWQLVRFITLIVTYISNLMSMTDNIRVCLIHELIKCMLRGNALHLHSQWIGKFYFLI